ncbi:MAG: MBL fold metallo-hydrolase [Bacilli bacterium]|jgi:glyoxylase-like metal-dependent hydrolase (beta-lactamase superfamily II)|nr:MBL fold metallo-hydrolase [Bacilli bacterium]MDD3388856.1 MBL fold metallo-hydrolase [Bacilli bacterium]MDD4344993.1 MBL fold metallo-hydrolase [Bacilli bacterium]MDD4520536.1 MBL fold metallo-hydrolase [Bacilli bacterium]MDY0399228.1 MBL fold metallo-hydrolase [Bacilli bacterium]
MSGKVETFTYPERLLRSNMYFIDAGQQQVVIVDPSVAGSQIIDFLNKRNLKPLAILLTHGHFDHVRGVLALINEYHIPCLIGENELDYLDNRWFMGEISEEVQATNLLQPVYDQAKFTFGALTLTVLATPFHSFGSVCYYFEQEKMLFSGDTLFKGSVGRTDLYGSAPRLMQKSLTQILQLPQDTRVYPGHGEKTTINQEVKYNRFL